MDADVFFVDHVRMLVCLAVPQWTGTRFTLLRAPVLSKKIAKVRFASDFSCVIFDVTVTSWRVISPNGAAVC